MRRRKLTPTIYEVTTYRTTRGEIRQKYVQLEPAYMVTKVEHADKVGKGILERDRKLFESIQIPYNPSKMSKLETKLEILR